MARYFIEVAYKGTSFAGFQAQPNQLTIQGEINHALSTLFKISIDTTTSSRTDAGVHAYQNFLHVDINLPIPKRILYSLNAIVHEDIAIRNIYRVADTMHARFDASARKYAYYIYQQKNPFYKENAYFFPFTLDTNAMQTATQYILGKHDFTSFSKKHTDVNNFYCDIQDAYWEMDNDMLIFHVQANRFLRGMVRAIVGTLLQVGRKKISPADFLSIIQSKDCSRADFSAVGKGLFLEKVIYPLPLQPLFEHNQ